MSNFTQNPSASFSSLVPANWDALTVTYPSGTQEVYTFRVNGITGTSRVVVTVNYTDSTKANIDNVTRTFS